MTAIRRMPNSERLESVVLACAILEPQDFLAPVVESLTAECFHVQRRAELFRVLEAMHAQRKHVDMATVTDACAAMPEALAELAQLEYQAGVTDIEPHCSELRAYARSRLVIRTTMRVASEGFEGTHADQHAYFEAAARSLGAVLTGHEDACPPRTMGVLLSGSVARLDREEPRGVSTGLRALDEQLGGLKRGKLYVFAGRPGMGKSALALRCAEAVSASEQTTLFFSLEMQGEELADRVLSARSRVSVQEMHSGQLGKDAVRFLVKSASDLSSLPILVVDDQTKIEALRRQAHTVSLRHSLGLVVVDYLQLLRARERFGNREQEVAFISREMKLMATELQVPVIAVAQLNRTAESRADKRPLLSDLRESGAIEQDADVVIMLFREGYYNSKIDPTRCELIIAKHRGGPVGTVEVEFNPRLTRFENATKSWAAE